MFESRDIIYSITKKFVQKNKSLQSFHTTKSCRFRQMNNRLSQGLVNIRMSL